MQFLWGIFFNMSWMGGVENYNYQHKVYQAYCRLKKKQQ